MSKPILTVIKTNKLWIALQVERDKSLSMIIKELEANKTDILAYRDMTSTPSGRMWQTVGGTPLGKDASKFNSPSVRVESGLSAGIASLFYDKALRRIEAQRRELKHKPLSEVLKRAESEAPSCNGSISSCISQCATDGPILNSAVTPTKKGGVAATSQTPIVEITLRGTPSEIFAAMREILAGAVLTKE